MNTTRQIDIFGIILINEPISISGILQKMSDKVSIPTLNRDLALLKKSKFIHAEGFGPNTKYKIDSANLKYADIDPDLFFKIDVDDRKIIDTFNANLVDEIKKDSHFTEKELLILNKKTDYFQKKIKNITPEIYRKEFERLMIELSWKSSQIEGNTYDLLDTEQLLKFNIKSKKHTLEESQMLLNHKCAIEYTNKYAKDFKKITVAKIIEIHTLLTKDMGISKNIRTRLVKITGTKYTPPTNQFQIKEAMEKLCKLINSKKNVFDKALLALLFISYIQPFEDGNKRTARLTANAILMSENYCPLSYRSISPSEYKKAILLFYELNNIIAFKKIFIAQYQFAIEQYF